MLTNWRHYQDFTSRELCVLVLTTCYCDVYGPWHRSLVLRMWPGIKCCSNTRDSTSSHLPSRFKLTFRRKVSPFKPRQSVANSVKEGCIIQNPGDLTVRWARRKQDWTLQENTWTSRYLFWTGKGNLRLDQRTEPMYTLQNAASSFTIIAM